MIGCRCRYTLKDYQHVTGDRRPHETGDNRQETSGDRRQQLTSNML
jgi:hypothetical protein